MKGARAMVAFEVRLNGKKLCRAGVSELGVLTTVLTWVRRQPGATGGRTVKELRLEVGGLDSSGRYAGQHSRWVRRRLRVGDRVSVKIVEAGRVDAPADRYRLRSL